MGEVGSYVHETLVFVFFFVIRFVPFVLVDFDRVFFLVLLTCFNVL